MAPRQISRSQWELTVDSVGKMAALAAIPGIRLSDMPNTVIGTTDAVAAACVASGLQAPAKWGSSWTRADLPSKDALRAYQREGIGTLASIISRMGGALLADEMGLGKTAQAITLASLHPGPRFIVTPASARETWREQLAKWTGSTSVSILGPSATKASKLEWENAPTADWVVSSYDLASKALKHAFTAAGRTPNFLIVDEAHLAKGRASKRADAVEVAGALATYRLMLTGTPMWNRPKDLWRLLKILFGQTTFGSKYDFDLRYCGGRIDEWGGMDNEGSSNTAELKLRLSYYMVRREKADVAKELPPVTRTVQWVDQTKSALRAFHTAVLMKAPRSTSEALEATLSGKTAAALELAASLKQFLLFTWRRDDARQMAKSLAENYGTPCVCITGDIETKERQALVAYAREHKQGVVATIDSAGTGLDGLQHVASTGIMHALDWVPLKMAQAEARLHRMGQTLPVTWIYLAMRESMDERVVSVLLDKLDQASQIVGQTETTDGLSSTLSAFTKADESLLNSLYEGL